MIKYQESKKPSQSGGFSKGKAIAAIFVVVILAHWIAFYFIWGGSGKKDAAQSTKEEAAAKTENKAEGAKAEAAKPAPSKSEAIVIQKTPIQNFGTPYDYSMAVTGDIPELPDCRNATTGILVDPSTRVVIWAKKPTDGVPIASMTKMMTILVALESINSGKGISTDTLVQVTPSAMKIGGSQVYLDAKESFPLGELLKTLAISSANDSAQLIAEFIGYGDSASFVSKMNEKAKELKMQHTLFHNPHGLPGETSADDNISCAEGMSFLAEQLLQYPIAMKWASTKTDIIRKDGPNPFLLNNHNKLVGVCQGVDGLKTGYIKRSGYCVTTTCKRNNERLIAVVTGFPRGVERDAFMRKLLDWGYRKLYAMKNKSQEETQVAKADEPAPRAKKTSKAAAKKSARQ